ncbi:hypothetical protein PVAG01_05985 [Phlyctema vagabunda]|uniref:Uncharacterized protein n=1 Tax=Phlyctema vagabunda TaxID=108571 RepID=A0ABR4PEX9_9HELO
MSLNPNFAQLMARPSDIAQRIEGELPNTPPGSPNAAQPGNNTTPNPLLGSPFSVGTNEITHPNSPARSATENHIDSTRKFFDMPANSEGEDGNFSNKPRSSLWSRRERAFTNSSHLTEVGFAIFIDEDHDHPDIPPSTSTNTDTLAEQDNIRNFVRPLPLSESCDSQSWSEFCQPFQQMTRLLESLKLKQSYRRAFNINLEAFRTVFLAENVLAGILETRGLKSPQRQESLREMSIYLLKCFDIILRTENGRSGAAFACLLTSEIVQALKTPADDHGSLVETDLVLLARGVYKCFCAMTSHFERELRVPQLITAMVQYFHRGETDISWINMVVGNVEEDMEYDQGLPYFEKLEAYQKCFVEN